SINEGHKIGFDNNLYKTKIRELKAAYQQASKLTGHLFYLPLTKGDIWQITRFSNGQEEILDVQQFKDSFK
ncbi:MAG: hypothetical protein ACI4Q7_04000, partial [Candidatus Avelusimicrobium sp.]